MNAPDQLRAQAAILGAMSSNLAAMADAQDEGDADLVREAASRLMACLVAADRVLRQEGPLGTAVANGMAAGLPEIGGLVNAIKVEEQQRKEFFRFFDGLLSVLPDADAPAHVRKAQSSVLNTCGLIRDDLKMFLLTFLKYVDGARAVEAEAARKDREDAENASRTARGRFDRWIASLPAVENPETEPFGEEQLRAQEHVLAKLPTAEDRTALFHFTMSLVSFLVSHGAVTSNIVLLPDGTPVIATGSIDTDTLPGPAPGQFITLEEIERMAKELEF